jgi:hypothetical protein
MFKIWAISLFGCMSGGRIKKEKSQINWRPLWLGEIISA